MKIKIKIDLSILPILNWHYIAEDDFIFRDNDYCLRVEQMNKRYWWWSVTKGNKEIAFDNIRAESEIEAKFYAELFYLKYKLKCHFKKD